MVKGVTRQVIVVKGTGDEMFDQAIFLVRDHVISNGGFSEKELLREAKQLYQNKTAPLTFHNLLWSSIGAIIVSSIWLTTCLIK